MENACAGRDPILEPQPEQTMALQGPAMHAPRGGTATVRKEAARGSPADRALDAPTEMTGVVQLAVQTPHDVHRRTLSASGAPVRSSASRWLGFRVRLRCVRVDLPAQRAFYDRLWADVAATELNGHEQARLQEVDRCVRRLKLATGARILEVGCGRGWLSGLVLSRYGDVHAIDLSEESVVKARAAFPHVTWEAGDVFREALAPERDLVVASEVIEHVADHARFVDVLVDAVRPGGWLLVTTPNRRLEQAWRTRPSFRPQPIERWLLPAELRAVIGVRCEIVRSGTFFFGCGDGVTDRLARRRPLRVLRSRTGGRDPASRCLSRLERGLYSIVLARRR
jgi:SAM-dependent methyltransferase